MYNYIYLSRWHLKTKLLNFRSNYVIRIIKRAKMLRTCRLLIKRLFTATSFLQSLCKAKGLSYTDSDTTCLSRVAIHRRYDKNKIWKKHKNFTDELK